MTLSQALRIAYPKASTDAPARNTVLCAVAPAGGYTIICVKLRAGLDCDTFRYVAGQKIDFTQFDGSRILLEMPYGHKVWVPTDLFNEVGMIDRYDPEKHKPREDPEFYFMGGRQYNRKERFASARQQWRDAEQMRFWQEAERLQKEYDEVWQRLRTQMESELGIPKDRMGSDPRRQTGYSSFDAYRFYTNLGNSMFGDDFKFTSDK